MRLLKGDSELATQVRVLLFDANVCDNIPPLVDKGDGCLKFGTAFFVHRLTLSRLVSDFEALD